VKFAGRNSENQKWENVFNGGATTSGRMDKRKPLLDSERRIGLRSNLTNHLTVVLMVFMGDKVVGAEFRKSEKWENVFNGGATTRCRMDKQGLQLDSPRRIGLGSTPHESSDCRVDGLYGDKVVGAEFQKSEKWENVFNGGATTSGRMDKRRPQLDSTH